jgi:hypothetical protein
VSVGFLLRATSRNPSPLLVAFVALWVLSPFGALLLADAAARRWAASTRAALRGVMLAVALGSAAVYIADALWPRASQPAFVFIVVPPASWLLGGAVLAVAATILGRRSGRADGV